MLHFLGNSNDIASELGPPHSHEAPYCLAETALFKMDDEVYVFVECTGVDRSC